MQADKGKEQGQWDDDGDDEGRPPVEHEEGNEQGDQQDTFHEVMEDGMGGVVDQVFAVVVGDDLGVLRQD